MDKEKTLQKIQESTQNTMNSAIGIEITDVGEWFYMWMLVCVLYSVLGYCMGCFSGFGRITLGSIIGSMQIDSNTEMVVGVAINANHLKSIRKGLVSIPNPNW